MPIIGIAGPIGAGKSYVTELFKNRGVPTIDADHVYHLLVGRKSDLTQELADEFGKEILKNNGALDRKKLGQIVFNDKERLSKLNEITHKHVIEKILRRYYLNIAKGHHYTVVEVPLMFESGFNKKCCRVIGVVADEEKRIQRIMKRNRLSLDEATKRVKIQKNNQFYIENSDYIVYNNTYDEALADFERIFTEFFGPYHDN